MVKKDAFFVGSTRKDIKGFSEEARQEIGTELLTVQYGFGPSDWKFMPSVGQGVKELRVHTENEYRTIYIVKFEEGIYVLHAFVKKTQKTSQRDIQIAKKRFSDVLAQRRERLKR